jgi:hypothetical protein
MHDVAMTIARFTEQLSRALDDAHSDAQSLEALSVSGSSAKPWDFDVRDLLEHNDLVERLLHLCTSKSTMVPKRSLNCAWKLLTQATRSAPPAVAKRALDSAAGVVIAALHDVDVGTVSTSSECVHLAKFYAAQLVTLARNNTVAAFRTGVGAPKTDTLSPLLEALRMAVSMVDGLRERLASTPSQDCAAVVNEFVTGVLGRIEAVVLASLLTTDVTTQEKCDALVTTMETLTRSDTRRVDAVAAFVLLTCIAKHIAPADTFGASRLLAALSVWTGQARATSAEPLLRVCTRASVLAPTLLLDAAPQVGGRSAGEWYWCERWWAAVIRLLGCVSWADGAAVLCDGLMQADATAHWYVVPSLAFLKGCEHRHSAQFARVLLECAPRSRAACAVLAQAGKCCSQETLDCVHEMLRECWRRCSDAALPTLAKCTGTRALTLLLPEVENRLERLPDGDRVAVLSAFDAVPRWRPRAWDAKSLGSVQFVTKQSLTHGTPCDPQFVAEALSNITSPAHAVAVLRLIATLPPVGFDASALERCLSAVRTNAATLAVAAGLAIALSRRHGVPWHTIQVHDPAIKTACQHAAALAATATLPPGPYSIPADFTRMSVSPEPAASQAQGTLLQIATRLEAGEALPSDTATSLRHIATILGVLSKNAPA